MNFEIRIFANPAGFEELRLSIPPKYSLFPDEAVVKRNFDGERGLFPNGTFSVFFSPEAYIIAYHFSLSSEAQFRDSEAHIAVAIQRGYKILEPTATFQELANEFSRIAIEHKQSATNQIYRNSEKFYEIVNAKIVEDRGQLRFNVTNSASKRAIVAVDSPQACDALLSDPFRPELKGVDILFVIRREDGQKVAHLITAGYRAIPNIALENPRTFTLVYPDGNRVAFTDLNALLPDYTIQRKYEKPLTYSGSVGDNLATWKIAISEDKSEYVIGLLPEKDRKEYKIEAYDQRTKINPALISASIGRFINGTWVLEGEEIERIAHRPITDLFSIAGYQINSYTKPDDSSVRLNISKLYSYDLTELFRFLNEALGKNAKVDIRSKSNNQFCISCDFNSRLRQLPIPYTDAYVIVPETPTTEKSTLEFNSSGSVSIGALKKKKTGEITLTFSPDCAKELKKKLQNGEKVGTYSYKYYVPGRKDPFQKEESIYFYPVIIKDLPLLNVQLEVNIDGYHPYQDEVNLKGKPDQEVVCYLKPTSATLAKQYCKKYLPAFIIGVILGALIGLLVANTWGSFLPSNKAMQEKVDALSADSLRLSQEINTLRSQITDSKAQPDTPAVDEDVEEEEDDDDNSSASTTPTLTPQQINIINKLKGEDFTWTDIDNAKKLLRGTGNDGLINDAEACLVIINLPSKDKAQTLDENSFIYKNSFNKISHHRAIMTKIINNEEYQTTSQKKFTSIKNLKDRLGIQ